MSQFVQDLWDSIFTPGPTPSLLIATNATFAALQVVLAALLFATYSIHFVILSFLSAALWYAINWFARELQENHDQELKEKARAARKTTMARAQTSDSETEVETFLTRSRTKGQPGTGASKEIQVEGSAVGELKQRAPTASQTSQDSKSSVSTEDEWEKVSEYESEKTK